MKIIAALLIVSLFKLAHAEPLKVGVIVGFTGPWASYGKATRDGIELSQSEGLVKYFYEDDQFLPRLSVSAARKLIEIDKVDAIVVGDTTTGKAVVTETERAKIPLIIWASEDEAFKNKPRVFRAWPTLAEEANKVSQAVAQEGYKKIALWTGPHTYSVAYGEVMKKTLGDKVISHEQFDQELTDYRPFILRIKEQGVDALNLCLNPGQHAIAFKNLTALHFSNVNLFGCNMINFTDDVEALKRFSLQAWIFDTEISGAFIEAYAKRAGTRQMVNSAAIFHDIGQLLSRAALIKKEETIEISLDEALRRVESVNGANGKFAVRTEAGDQYLSFELRKLIMPQP